MAHAETQALSKRHQQRHYNQLPGNVVARYLEIDTAKTAGVHACRIGGPYQLVISTTATVSICKTLSKVCLCKYL